MFPILRAQAPSGTLSGTVYDGSGSVLPAAGVSLLNEATRDFRITAANTEGFFSLIAISPGTYTLQIEFPGFVAWRRTGIVLRVSDRINIPSIVLEVSSSSDEVTVTGSWSGLFPADNGEKAAIITKNEMQNLAIVGRSAVDLMKILPSVVYTGTGFPGEMVTFGGGLGHYHVAGGRADGVAILSDGADVIDPGCDCGAAVTPNVDLVSEVKVQVAAYGADQAKGPVVFQSVSKSGSTEFHGESYVYWRTNSFASQDWRANHFGTPKPEEKYYFPGFNVGGPLSKSRDRLFFFAGFEWMGQNFTEGDIPAVVPTAGMRLGDFTEVCSGELVLKGYNGCPANDFWGNWTDPGFEGLENGIIDPDLFDPGGKALTNLYPLPNRDPARIDGWNYVSNILRSQNRDQELARLDWTISDNTRLYTRFNHEFEGANYPYTLWWSNPEQVPSPSKALGNYHSWSSSTSLASVLSPSMTNEIVVAATYLNLAHELENPDAVSKTETGYPYQGIFDNHIDMIPSLLGASGFAMLYQAGGVINPGIFAKKWLTSLVDNFSKVFNTHTLKVGLRWAYTSNDEAPNPRAGDQGEFAFASWGDNATGNGYADLLLGRAASFGHSMTPLVAYLRRHEISGFIQDSWRASRRLTLDLGIRFDNNGFFHDREGHLAGFDASTYDPDAPLEAYSGVVAPYLGHDVPRSIWKSPGLLFSPRFGFAYDLSGSGRTVLRGGAGAYRYHGRGGNSMAGFSFNPPLVSTTWKCCGFFMWEMDQLDPDRTRSRFEGLEPYNDAYPATYSFSLTLSRRLPFDLFWETSYVGNTSSHLLGRRLLDAIPEGTMPVGANNDDGYRPYTSFISVGALGHMLSQNY
ncbi:MAG: carboxypeptidase regulatory-like domain-containing protein, partial [Acidobacteriota bacterium]